MTNSARACLAALLNAAFLALAAQAPSVSSATAQTTFVGRISDARYGTRVVPVKTAERSIAAGDWQILKISLMSNQPGASVRHTEMVQEQAMLSTTSAWASPIIHGRISSEES